MSSAGSGARLDLAAEPLPEAGLEGRIPAPLGLERRGTRP